ncbi:MAG: hypothetical protein ACJAWT_002193 [Glaciecola sp.]|jgi:hypothetical protein
MGSITLEYQPFSWLLKVKCHLHRSQFDYKSAVSDINIMPRYFIGQVSVMPRPFVDYLIHKANLQK